MVDDEIHGVEISIAGGGEEIVHVIQIVSLIVILEVDGKGFYF